MRETNHSNGGRNHAIAPARTNRRRLAGLGLTVIVGGLLVYAVRWNSWQQLDRLKQEVATVETESFQLGVKLRDGVGRLNDAVLRSQLSRDDPTARDAFFSQARQLKQLLARTRPELTTEVQREIAARFEREFATYLTNLTVLIERPVKAVRRESAAQVYTEIDAAARPVLERCDQLVTAQASAWNDFLQEFQASLGSMQTALHISTWVLLAMVLAVVVLIHRLFVAPLETRLSQTEALMERKARLASLGTLAAGVAHEIRNPLAAIKFRLFSVKKALPSDLANHDDLRVIASEINRLERIVEEFLQFARPAEPVRKEVPVAPMLQEVHALLAPPMQRKGVQFTCESSPALAVHADRQQLIQVLINLAQNAAESIEGEGRVALSARSGAARWAGQSRPAVILEVTDTGKGIPPDVEPRLFDPFFSTRDGGTGLGLPIAARIVELHGGTLQYQTQPGRGTTFQVVLPRLSDHASQNPSH